MAVEPIQPAPSFEVGRYLMRARRSADLSQRDLAAALGVSQSTVARWETGESSPGLGDLLAALRQADFHLQVVDAHGSVVEPFSHDGARNNGGRRYPAHLDVHPADRRPPDPWWGAPSNQHPSPGWCARRRQRDWLRSDMPAAANHPTAQKLAARAAEVAQHERARRAAQSEAQRARRRPRPEPAPCFCPDRCDEIGLCVPECECRCD